jgi:hypothetical protein
LRFSDGEVSSIFDFEVLVEGFGPTLIGEAAIQFINKPAVSEIRRGRRSHL